MHTPEELSSGRALGFSEPEPSIVLMTKERLLNQSPFGSLGEASREALYPIGSVEKLPRRARIAQQGEAARCLYLVGSGRVKLERVNGDRVFSVGHRGPGETVGETALGGSPLATETAVVLDDVEALAFPLTGLRKLLAIDEALRRVTVALLVERRLAAEKRLESLLLRGVEARLVDFLLASVDRWGEAHTSGELISAPFTHADIALLVGSTRETVTLVLGKLKRAGLIELEKRRIVVRDRDALGRHAAAP
jgi:CRP-like cAMP-binding protein